MGGEYYGRNDYRDYLAHYGVKGMKWKKQKKAFLREELLRERRARDMSAEAREAARAGRLNRIARREAARKAALKEFRSHNSGSHIGVTSSIRVQRNSTSLMPGYYGKKAVKKATANKKSTNKLVKALKKKSTAKKVKNVIVNLGGRIRYGGRNVMSF